MLSIHGLKHRYAGGPELVFTDAEAPQGARIRLVGPSGSGKSTLLALVAGLLSVQAGHVVVGGVDVATLEPAARDAWRGATLGFMPQRLHLSDSLTVAQNLALPYLAAGLPVDGARIDEMLGRLGLRDLAGRRPGHLSLGQAQRVALARAVLRRPRIVLADEPTANLDDEAASAALALLEHAAAQSGATLVVATHDARVQQAWPDALAWRLARSTGA